jgi:aspartyl aminopeptidase
MTSLAVSKNVEGFLNFINRSPTAFHCKNSFHSSSLIHFISVGVENVKTTLTSAGFKELRESEQWNIEPLGKVNIEHEMINKIRLNSFFSTL